MAVYDPEIPVTKDTTTLFASDRDVFVFLVDDRNPIEVGKLANGEPDLMFRGFYAWNSETGSKTAGIAAMYLRGVCMNRCLWGVENFHEIKIRHTKFAPDRFAQEAYPALQSFATGSTTKGKRAPYWKRSHERPSQKRMGYLRIAEGFHSKVLLLWGRSCDKEKGRNAGHPEF